MKTNYDKYLEVIDYFDIKEDGRIFKKERIVENNGGFQKHPYKEVKQNKIRGYLGVNFMVDGKNYHLYSHVLVKLFFDGLPDNLDYIIDHKDGNKHNNNLSNLEYVSQKENCLRAFKLGLNYVSEKGLESRKRRMTENNPMKNKEIAKKSSEKRKGKHQKRIKI